MNELVVADSAAQWHRLKALVLDSVSSPITKRVYNMALDEFFDWYQQEPRPGFNKAVVNAWRVRLDEREPGRRPSSCGCRPSGSWPWKRPTTGRWRPKWPPVPSA